MQAGTDSPLIIISFSELLVKLVTPFPTTRFRKWDCGGQPTPPFALPIPTSIWTHVGGPLTLCPLDEKRTPHGRNHEPPGGEPFRSSEEVSNLLYSKHAHVCITQFPICYPRSVLHVEIPLDSTSNHGPAGI